jgi:hypothetical protein
VTVEHVVARVPHFALDRHVRALRSADALPDSRYRSDHRHCKRSQWSFGSTCGRGRQQSGDYNGMDAMKEVDGARELVIKSQPAENGQLPMSVSDLGVGLPPQQADQIFKAFFTTKSHGTGMGLAISRSIVESHGGRLWAAANSPRGANFYFTLSANTQVQQ